MFAKQRGSTKSFLNTATTAVRNPITTPRNPRCLAQPLRILISTVEVVACLVQLKLSRLGSFGGFRQHDRDLLLVQGSKAAGRIQRLLQDSHRIASRDYYAGGKVHGIVQAFNGADRLTLKKEGVAHRLHTQDADVLLY